MRKKKLGLYGSCTHTKTVVLDNGNINTHRHTPMYEEKSTLIWQGRA